ncbi:hypothetical protein [Pseudomonas fontis]|uniref:NHL repeat containing protein n=1 Tax=Pseudomonas fontis TaxID=2942633 RepID=A0ABT5NXJ4_9PSED|nr:hypothetical protein [Pseudomonas fontis]MDD0973776.1 hypothetical protein [Pseudomonas fontis]MDD0992910.1 hypothetical protein [Pseudomonas fontis]
MKHLHFDLRHVERTQTLEVRVGSARYPLSLHSEQSLESAGTTHGALSLLPSEHQQRFSHFAAIDKAHFTDTDSRYLQVVIPERDGVHLPQVVAMCVIIPEDHLRVFWQERLERYQQPLQQVRAFHRHTVARKPKVHCARLAHLGLRSLPDGQSARLDALVQSQTLVTPLDTAAALVSHHPGLASIQPSTSVIVLNDHILPSPEVDPEQYNRMQLLAAQIGSLGQDWSPIVACQDADGNALVAEYDLPGQIEAGQALYTYGVHEDLDGHLGAGLAGANRSAANDLRLMDKTWAASSGTTFAASERAADEAAVRAETAGGGESRYRWTVNERTVHHGILVDAGSIDIDHDSQLSIDVSNTYLRTLVAGYQLLDATGQPLGGKVRLQSISATNSILGIPCDTQPSTLDIPMGSASGVRLYFASLGVSDWDDDFSTSGALLTGLWQYGVPTVLMACGSYITGHREFNRIVNDRQLTAAALAIGLPMLGGGLATASAVLSTRTVMVKCANVIVGLILRKGMEALGKWLAGKCTTGVLGSCLGPIGWVFRTAATLMSIEEMAVTTGEVLSSPSCVKVMVSRAIDVSLSLHPDPVHGEAGNPQTAVWPAVASNYVAYLEYQGGTNHKLTGSMPQVTSSTPLTLRFDDVPAGGQFRVLVGLYSDNGWLAGSWQSDWMTAQANHGTTLELGAHNIVEQLVPLSPDTQYVFKERIAVERGRYVWQAGAPPQATHASLACGSDGTLCELVDISLNSSAYQIGYAWRASGQHLPTDSTAAAKSDAQQYVLQNLSVLADPQSRLIVADIGLSNRPGIAWSQANNQHERIEQDNFILDPRGSAMHLRKVILGDGASTFGLGERGLQSWGQFPLNTIDALAIHPDGIVLAASWKDSKLMFLPLPAQGSPDSEAPMATMVAGEGIRQGLLRGPKAISVMPDGRILVLETENHRVQAFDTKGNAVPGFTPFKPLLSIDSNAIAAALNDGVVPEAFIQALVDQEQGYLFSLSTSFVKQLDEASFAAESDPLLKTLNLHGLVLAYDPQAMGDRSASAQIHVVEPGHEWTLDDPRGSSWQVRLRHGVLAVYQRPCRARVEVIAPGSEWHILDGSTGQAWRIRPSTAQPRQSLVYWSLSYFPLQGARGLNVTYLDMAVEARGYVYVLSYTGDGSQASDYLLDIHAPDGSFLSRSPDPSLTRTPHNVVAGKLAVDLWRNVYGLMFETLKSPSGTTQPGIGHWMPTPPLFDMPVSQQPRLNEHNIGEVKIQFDKHGINLTPSAFIDVIDPNGAWSIKDVAATYHIYRVADSIHVYAVQA